MLRDPQVNRSDGEKYLLCRPKGGLTDNLCQMAKCWMYAKKYHRTIIFDTEQSAGFYRPFDQSFEFLESRPQVGVKVLSSEFHSEMDEMNVFPHVLKGRVSSYPSQFVKNKNFVDVETSVQLTFDFDRAYGETLLVHENCGGNNHALGFLSMLKMKSELKEEVIKRLSPCREVKNYKAVVIRHNNDYQSNYLEFLETISKDCAGEDVLVCSDNIHVIKDAMNYLSESRVITLDSSPDTEGEGFAFYGKRASASIRHQLHIKGISDLIGLGAASQLFACPLNHHAGPKESGFVVLAKQLNQNKGVIDQLLSKPS